MSTDNRTHDERGIIHEKLVCLILALVVTLCSAFAVQAEEAGTVNLTEAHAYETATSLCFIEDTLYMLGAYGIYEYKKWDAGDDH